MRLRVLNRALAAAFVAGIFTPMASAGVYDGPIPQKPGLREKIAKEILDGTRRMLGEAYQKVGKKNPKWDALAADALEKAALWMSATYEKPTDEATVHAAVKKAIDAGCDDPLILFFYARTIDGKDVPDRAERERRFVTAAAAMERSAYPATRRAVALSWVADLKVMHVNDPEARKEAARLTDAVLTLLAENYERDRKDRMAELSWQTLTQSAFLVLAVLANNDRKKAYDQLDARLLKTPALQPIRLERTGDFYITYAWEARGNGMASTVSPAAFEQFESRLTAAGKALQRAYALDPNNGRVCSLMLVVLKGLGGDRATVEKWFQRAMEADPSNLSACANKMDWLDPKWHGTAQDLISFGRACRDVPDVRSRIPILVANAHWRVASHMTDREQQTAYYFDPEVWNDIRRVYEERLKVMPKDDVSRAEYACFSAFCNHKEIAAEQFRILGGRVQSTRHFPKSLMDDIKQSVGAP